MRKALIDIALAIGMAIAMAWVLCTGLMLDEYPNAHVGTTEDVCGHEGFAKWSTSGELTCFDKHGRKQRAAK